MSTPALFLVFELGDPHTQRVYECLLKANVEPRRITVCGEVDRYAVAIDHGAKLFEINSVEGTYFHDEMVIWYYMPTLIPVPVVSMPSDLSPEHAAYCVGEWEHALAGLASVLENAKWVNCPMSIRDANIRLHQLTTARRLGLKVPASLVTNIASKAVDFIRSQRGRVVYKALQQNKVADASTGGALFSTEISESTVLENVDSFSLAPCLLQQVVKKRWELRVYVVGGNALGFKIAPGVGTLLPTDYRLAGPDEVKIERERLTSDCQRVSIELVSRLGLRYGAVDFALDEDDDLVFFEVNPCGTWLWLPDDLGAEIPVIVATYLRSLLVSENSRRIVHG